MVYLSGNEQLQLTYVLTYFRSEALYIGCLDVVLPLDISGVPMENQCLKESIYGSVDLLTMDFAVMVTEDQWLK